MSRYLLAGACLTTLVVAVYFQTCWFEFLGFDDPQLVTENLHVRQGLTPHGLKWAFFSAWRENLFFYPLSLVSHMADVTLFGLDPGRHHLTSVALHAAVTLFFFVLLARLTGELRRSALAAGLFAVHPLAVDSVAWVAERDGFDYVRHAAVGKKRWYGFSLGLFFLALLAKPTAVMAPFGLFLISRLQSLPVPAESSRPRTKTPPVFLKLLPFFILAAARVLVLLASGRGGSPVAGTDDFTAGALAANALVAVATYPVRIFYPFGLSIYYPFSPHPSWWRPLVSGCSLLLITIIFLKYGRRRPMVRLGWLWYLLFLVPSLGAVRSGPWPAMADHYVYVPSMGLFIILAWIFTGRAVASPFRKMVMAGMAGFLLIFFAILSFLHAGHYRNSVTVFTRAVSLNQQNFLACIGLGNAYQKLGKMAAAEENFRKAVAIRPESAGAHNNLGLVLTERGAWAQAENHFKIALALSPGFSMARDNLANLYLKQEASRTRQGDPAGDMIRE